jgi:uncharacterized protein (TIGR03643 family)
VRRLFKEKAEVQKCPIDRLARLSAGDISAVIQMAWEDRTTFETIQERLGLNESDVIALMRAELNPSSFKLWRMRVRGRVTKHRALRSPQMKYDDQRWRITAVPIAESAAHVPA